MKFIIIFLLSFNVFAGELEDKKADIKTRWEVIKKHRDSYGVTPKEVYDRLDTTTTIELANAFIVDVTSYESIYAAREAYWEARRQEKLDCNGFRNIVATKTLAQWQGLTAAQRQEHTFRAIKCYSGGK